MSYSTAGVQKNTNEFLPNQGELLAALAEIQGMTSVSVSINTEKTNVIMGTEIHNLWGESTIEDTIHVRDMQKENYPYTGDALTFKISPLSFYQVNPVQTEKLYSLALEYAGLTGKETVWDLYCGIGTISLFLAGKAKRYAVWKSSPRPSTMPERMQRETILKMLSFRGQSRGSPAGILQKGNHRSIFR